MDVSKILWPTDFSENAVKALPWVTALAEKFGAEIHILYVLKEYVEFGAAYGYYDPEDADRMQRWEKETAEKRLTEICDTYLNSCPLYFRHLAVGHPAKEILNLVESEKIDLLIMASRGRESHFDFGSVAEKVLRCSSVPVMMIPA